ncbi:DUF2326 domain-containing protein [Anaerolineales bacterium HSG6]|nr:DUF2326 domain-containing protein [Anaerolineales bacterium HSG6]
MIYRVYSDLPTFKNLEFREGLNILVSTKSPGATDQHTRNGAGKTSLIEIIHFLTGANAPKDSLLKNGALVRHNFGMAFDLGGKRVTVERSGWTSGQIKFPNPVPNHLPVEPQFDSELDVSTVTNTHWKNALGNLIFNLPIPPKKRSDKESYIPTFRSLFAYFVRREKSNAFISAFEQSKQQKPWDKQVAISYLIGLDWTIAQQWQHLRDKEKRFGELKRAAKDGDFGEVIGTTAELRTELAVIEGKVQKLDDNLERFNVLPEYRELEKQMSGIVQQQSKLSDDDVIDHRLIDELTQAMDAEIEPASQNIDRLYAEVGIVLPDTVVRRFEEVQAFHKSVVKNRRSYLQGELNSATQRIEDRKQKRVTLNDRHIEIMEILHSHGALDQYNKMNMELSRLEGEAKVLRQQFELAEKLESQKVKLKSERSQLLLRLQQDYREQNERLNEAISIFEDISAQLYQKPGSLIFASSDNGPTFDFGNVQGIDSTGIGSMQIFCFDMMLMQMNAKNRMNQEFLVHDSRMFDGVDGRQVMKALEIGANLAEKHGFQYIVTINSDDLTETISSGFSVDDYILQVQLTDATEDGGLFGMRF